ncbi:MAG TPA: peptidase S8, partial [Chitinophagaceae bacterium]|nr:peptidase S8 [Chitinophagaceae bacterium]
TDDGVAITHPDLAENIWVNTGEIAGDGIDNDNNGYIDDVNGWDFSFNNNNPNPNVNGDSHGTHVGGIIAAR